MRGVRELGGGAGGSEREQPSGRLDRRDAILRGVASGGGHRRGRGGGRAGPHRRWGCPASCSTRASRRSSLDEANQQSAEQNCLFGNRQSNAYLLVPLFGQQSPNRTSFCSASLLLIASLEGGA